MAELADFGVQTAHGRLCELWFSIVQIIGDIFEIIGGRRVQRRRIQRREHPFDPGIHLGSSIELSPVCLFDTFANASRKRSSSSIKPQCSIHHELMRVLLQMRRYLRKLRLLLGSYLDFHILTLETRT